MVLLATASAVVVAAIGGDDAPQVSGDGPPSNQTDTAARGASGATADARFPRVAENASVGWAVSWVGDVDGDGTADLLVGAPGTDVDDREDAGAAYLFYGPVDPGDVQPAAANVTLLGASAGDRAGHAVSGAGDLDGDGHADLVVGAPFQDGGGSDAGAAYVVSGGESLPAEQNLTSAAVRLDGTDGDHAGWAVSRAADAAGTQAGVVVGAPRWDADGQNAGAAFLVSNETLATNSTVSLADGADARLVGESAGDGAGWAVSPAGDVTGDGSGDVLVGARSANATDAPAAGAAYVVAGPIEGRQGLGDAALHLRGAAAGDRAGYALADAGDVNDDGVADVLVGAPLADGDGQNAGAAYVVFGAEGLDGDRSLTDANVTVAGAASGDRLGWAVAATETPCRTLAVGAPGADAPDEDAGSVYAFTANGSLAGPVSATDANATISGEGAATRTGSAVALGNGSNATAAALAVGAPGGETDEGVAGGVVLDSVDCPDVTAPTSDSAAASDSAAESVEAASGAASAGGSSAAVADDASDDEPTTTEERDATAGADDSNETAATAGADDTVDAASDDTGTDPTTDGPTTSAEEATTDASGDEPAAADGGSSDTDATEAGEQSGELAVTATATPTETDAPAEDGENDGTAATDASLEVQISCEDPDHYVFNPTDEAVEVSVAGPDGTETFTVAAGDSHGGPSSPSHQSPSLPPGEYTVTAEGPDGGTVPVNGQSSFTTTVKECPTTTLSTECVDGQTVRVSVRADHLTGRHAAPVEIEVQSPIDDDRRRLTATPSDGVVSESFEVSDVATSTIWVELQGASPGLLATDTVDEGVCYDDVEVGAAQAAPETTAAPTTESGTADTETTTGQGSTDTEENLTESESTTETDG